MQIPLKLLEQLRSSLPEQAPTPPPPRRPTLRNIKEKPPQKSKKEKAVVQPVVAHDNECLSCWDPISIGKFLCEGCMPHTQSGGDLVNGL